LEWFNIEQIIKFIINNFISKIKKKKGKNKKGEERRREERKRKRKKINYS